MLEFERVIQTGGIVLFPSDTVYGLAVEPDRATRLFALKGRAAEKPAALMYFDLDAALAAHPEIPERARALLPGPVTLVLPSGVGLRCVDIPALAGVRIPVLQSSANRAGEPSVRRLADVDPAIRAGVDLEIDGGELPGVASTVIDLRDGWRILREGALDAGSIARALG
ncbi:MAG: Sua5/YciO/YrdC/YwlC family protein [Solirubrobacterales bacterium]|nr:Sua5/YciO/YrdC/YwlC family protein [Solirubrobacterales bacterium]